MTKRTLIVMFLAVLLGMFTFGFAEVYTIGTGTSASSLSPFYGYYDYSWSKVIWLASEMNTAGLTEAGEISGFGFYIGNNPVNYPMLNQKIFIRNSSTATYTLSAEPYPDNTQYDMVFEGTITYNGGGWQYVMFNNPFGWDGSSNLEVLFENWDADYVAGYPSFRYTSTSTNYRMAYKATDTTFPTTTGTRSYNRPNIQIVTPSTNPPTAALVNYPADGGWAFLNATLSWSPGGGMPTSYNLYFGTSENPDFIQNQTGVTYTPVLEENTTYYWQIIPENANGTAEECPIWSFRTPSSTQLAESFEATSFPPAGWANGASGNFTRSTTTPFHLTAGAYKLTSTSLTYYLSTPRLTIDDRSTLDFYAHTTSSNLLQKIQIIYSDDRVTWEQLGEDISLPSAGPWALYNIDLSPLAGNNYYLGFRVPSATTTGSIYIDHVFGPEVTPEIPGPATQALPLDAAVDMHERPTFTWTAPTTGGVAQGYYVYCDTNADPSTLIGTVTGLTYTSTITLDYATQYYWKVVAFNGAGDSENNTIRSFTVRNDPTIYPPLAQDFTTFPPTNWSRYTGLLADPITLTSTTSGWVADGFANAGTIGAAKINIYGTTWKYWLVTPPIDLGNGSTEYNMEFNLALTLFGATTLANQTGTDDKFAVVISTDGGATWNTANILRLWDNSGSAYVYNSISTTGELISLPLAGYTGVVAIGFYGESTVSNADNDLFIDNMAIVQAGIPPTPPTTGIPAHNATNVSVFTNLSWSGASGAPTGYIVNMGTDENMQLVADITESTYDLPGQLEYDTTYFWRIDAYNNYGANEGTVWQFTTVPDPTLYAENLPYSQNFDAVTVPALPLGWTKSISSTSSSAVVNTYTSGTPYTAPNHVYMYNYSDASAQLVLISPPIAPALNTLRVKFWAKGGTNYTLQVGTMNEMGAKATFTNFQTLTISGTYTEYTVDFSTYEGTDTYIAFKHGLGGTYRSTYIDDVRIEAIPTLPVFMVTPASKNFGTVSIGSSASQIFTITNSGVGSLGITGVALSGANTDQFALADANSYPVYLAANQSITVNVNMVPTTEGAVTASLDITDDLGQGMHNVALSGAGSDAANYGGGDDASTAGGYYYANNLSINAPASPNYVWINQTANTLPDTPTTGSTDDGAWGPIPIGFEFSFYGTPYTELYIGTNGLVSFGAAVTTFSNAAIPTAAVPNNTICLFWDDLEYYPGFSQIHYGSNAMGMTITYSNMGRTGSAYSAAASVTAQVILYFDGKIKMQYQDVTGTMTATHSATIGLENATGTKGVQYHFNGVGGPVGTAAKAGGVAVTFGDNPATLPVELSSFTAVLTSEQFVKIAWIAQSETNHSGYNVLRSDSNELDSAITINSSLIDDGTTLGTQISYTYTDVEAYTNMVYYYWLESVSLDGVSEFYGPLSVTIGDPGQDPTPPVIPMVTSLLNAFPNPFNPNTNLRYSLKEAGKVNIDIYNVKGQLVRSFNAEHNSPGYYQLTWDGRDANGTSVGSGIYMYRMTSGNYVSAKKMILAK